MASPGVLVAMNPSLAAIVLKYLRRIAAICWLLSPDVSLAKTPDPLLWLPLDEGTGTFADDRSPNQLEASLSNVGWVSGKFGTAVRFSGENSFIDLPEVPGLSGAKEFTISMWALWEGAAGKYPNLLSSRNWQPGGLLIFVADNTCSFRMGHSEKSSGDSAIQWQETGVPILNTLPQNEWVHICITYAQPEIRTYVNGKLIAKGSWAHLPEVRSLRLGGWQNSVSHRGLMDDLRIAKRALSAPEIAVLANDATRKEGTFEVIDDTSRSIEQAFQYDNGKAILFIDQLGRAVSLRDKKSGKELLAMPVPLVSATLADGRKLTARQVVRQGNDLVFQFKGEHQKAVVGLESDDGFFSFTVRSLDLPEAASLEFCRLAVAPRKYAGQMANMLSDDDFAVCLRGYDLPVEMSVSSSGLSVGTTSDHGLTGWRAGLAAGPKADMPAILRSMAVHAGVPVSKLGGPWSLGAEKNRGSYLFANLSHASTADWIRLADRGGISTIHLHGWWKTLGHYEPNPGYFPNGLDDMRDTVKQIHNAGLCAGIHTLTACIEPGDPWITPVPSPDLLAFETYTLDRKVSEKDTVLYVRELPTEKHDTVFTYSGNGNAIRIGEEIIQYSGISREKPYAFLDCKRGAFGTTPAAHTVNSQADYLQQRYISFYPKPDSPLADELAQRIAKVYNYCELDQLYFDGSEGMMSRYGIDAMRWKIFSQLQGDPLIEASCHGAHNWWFHSRLGAWDHPVWGAKQFHDAHIASASLHRKQDLLEPQLGWWSPRTVSAYARGHFIDEMEYFACKNMGMDGAMSIQGVDVTNGPLADGLEAQVTLLGWYERLRLARYFDQETIERIAKPGDEFRLRQSADGEWRFTPVKLDTRRMLFPAPEDEAWTVRNLYEEQAAGLRLEALYLPAEYDSPNRIPIAGEEDFPSWGSETSAASVKLEVTETADDVKEGTKNLRLMVKNESAASDGTWARATMNFPDPYRNLKGMAAIGLWVKGDGKGAMLNLQLGSPREYMSAVSNHYVTLDFTGWRYTELLMRERDTPLRPQGGNDQGIYRAPLDMEHISQFAVSLSNLPPGEHVEVVLSPIMALPIHSNEMHEPGVAINGKKIIFPFTLRSGEYLELESDGRCLHFSDRGDLLARHDVMETAGLPLLLAGKNSIRFFTNRADAGHDRVELTVIQSGKLFGGNNADAIDRKHLSREYTIPRRIISGSETGETWEIMVRPGEAARLEIEISGPVENPVLEIGGYRVNFPVKLEKDHRLACMDGKNWKVMNLKRELVAEGALDSQSPVLSGGSHPVVFSSGARNRPLCKLTKVYDVAQE